MPAGYGVQGLSAEGDGRRRGAGEARRQDEQRPRRRRDHGRGEARRRRRAPDQRRRRRPGSSRSSGGGSSTVVIVWSPRPSGRRARVRRRLGARGLDASRTAAAARPAYHGIAWRYAGACRVRRRVTPAPNRAAVSGSPHQGQSQRCRAPPAARRSSEMPRSAASETAASRPPLAPLGLGQDPDLHARPRGHRRRRRARRRRTRAPGREATHSRSAVPANSSAGAVIGREAGRQLAGGDRGAVHGQPLGLAVEMDRQAARRAARARGPARASRRSC